MNINRTVEVMPPSGIRAFFELVIGMPDVISLGVGEPDFVTPWHIREAAIFSIEEGDTSYTSNKGLIELRRDISKHLAHFYGMKYDPEEEILITVGVSEAFDLALRTLISPRDTVLIPEPAYVSYGPLVMLAGGTPVFVPKSLKDHFKVTARDIASKCDERTKIMILNYPNNPTGASYSKKELENIAAVVRTNDLIVISDEIYGDLTYDMTHTPFPNLPGMRERTVYLNGFSKTYAMTGWRIGFACGPREVIDGMTKIHQYTMLCASIMAQVAAREALKNGDASVREMKKEYRRRREFVVTSLNEIGLECHMPEGAFYTFPSIRVTRMSSIDFAKRLLKEEKVAVVPGVAFGPSGEGYIRLSYATSYDDLKTALARIGRFVARHSQRGKKR